jgi:hypothetical protein
METSKQISTSEQYTALGMERNFQNVDSGVVTEDACAVNP